METHELEEKYEQKVKITGASDIFKEMRDIKNWEKEVFVGFFLDSENRIISREIIAIGILNACIIHPREVFRTAIIRNANSLIITHNHPSGNVTPSAEDIEVTEKLKKVGEIIDIKLLDHIIVTKDNYYSIMTEQTIEN